MRLAPSVERGSVAFGCFPRYPDKKRAAVAGRSFVSSLEKDYLLILRRSAKTIAPRPSRPIVAGSGMAVWKFAV